MNRVEKEFAGRTYWATPETSARLDDPEPMLPYLEAVRPGEFFVDVGAGVGLYALRAAAMGARVLAFEPHRPTRRELLANRDLNRFERNFTVDSFVLWDGSPYPEDLRAEVFGRHYPVDEELEYATLDEIDLRGVGWVKLDVEGAELGVLRGARRTIERDRPVVLVEDHAGVNPDPSCVVSRYAEGVDSSREIRRMFEGLGYREMVLEWGTSGRRFLVFTP